MTQFANRLDQSRAVQVVVGTETDNQNMFMCCDSEVQRPAIVGELFMNQGLPIQVPAHQLADVGTHQWHETGAGELMELEQKMGLRWNRADKEHTFHFKQPKDTSLKPDSDQLKNLLQTMTQTNDRDIKGMQGVGPLLMYCDQKLDSNGVQQKFLVNFNYTCVSKYKIWFPS